MYGPKLNWKIYEEFLTRLKTYSNVVSINTGSCGLHIIDGAFADGAKAFLGARWTVSLPIHSGCFRTRLSADKISQM